jgi:hypothetical protein
MTHRACRRALLADQMTAVAHRHLAWCSPCSAFAEALSTVDTWRPADVPPPPDGLADRVVARLRAQTAADVPSPRRRSWKVPGVRFGPLAVGMSAVALIGLAVIAGAALHGGHRSGAGGGAATSPQPLDPCASSAHCVVITVDIAGDAMVSGTERQALNLPCTTLAAISQTFREKPTAGAIALPMVHSAGGHRLFISATIQPYEGPGEYVSGIGLAGGGANPNTFPFITIDGRDYASGTLGPTPRHATFTAAVRADGSGSLSFGGLVDTQDPTRTVAGLVTWVCA